MARRPGVAVWRRISARPDSSVVAFFAVLTVLPMLWTAPGRVSADTKSYLTIDPGKLLSRATSMWDASVGAGTVPHQNIGYLFPLGPYYWLLDAVGVPDWLAQRLVWALLVFAASWGTYRLLRWLGWDVAGAVVAAVAYGFSPYLLSYLARLSAILFPWAGLPWMILLAARAARERSWRPAVAFALVVATVGSVNATSLLFAGVGPVLWLLTDTASGRVSVRAVVAASARIGVLSLAVSVWWISGLRIQGTYGLPILDFTETYQTVASASTPPEILRGLGYWFFYGGDFLDPWVGPAAAYFNDPLVMFVSFAIAGCCLLGLLVPFRGRGAMLSLFLVGLVLSVGAAPLGDSTWFGEWFRRFATETTAGAALRSTPRAAPLVLLALACGLGACVGAVQRRIRAVDRLPQRAADLLPAAATVAVLVNLLPWFTGDVVSSSLLRPGDLPGPTLALADHLNDPGGPSGRIYAIPGSDFADYRWGGTVDPVLPGLTDRSVLYRELIPQGSPATADLLNAFERRLSEGWFEPTTLPAIAELFEIDTIVVRNDLQYERYRLARPGPLWTDVTGVLGNPDHSGPSVTDQAGAVLIDEITVARDDAAVEFPLLAAFDRDTGTGTDLLLRDATAPTIVAGDGDGLVDLAGAGLLDTSRPILYAASDPDLDAATDPWWIVTDTNRKQGHRWSTLGFNLGAIESAGALQTGEDPGDSRLDLFDDSLDDQTIAVHLGDVADVSASAYGSNIVYIAEDAPNFAIDGEPTTAWRGAIAVDSDGLQWNVDFVRDEPLFALTMLQPQVGANDRFVTAARITTDSGTFVIDLGEESRVAPGQRVELPFDEDGTRSLTVEVLADNIGDLASYAGQPGVGFAEITPIRPDGTPVVDDRVVRLPTVPLATGDGVGDDDRLTYLLTRQRLDPATPNRQAPELELDRLVDVPDRRTFTLGGQARLAGNASDDTLAELLDVTGDGLAAIASTRLPGSVASAGGSAVDGDLDTAWQTPFDGAVGASLTVSRLRPADTTELTVTWRDDGRHAVPTEISVGDGTDAVAVPLESVEAVDGLASTTVSVPIPSSGELTITITAVTGATIREYYSGVPRTLPVAIAEVDFGSAARGATADGTAPKEVDTGCRDDLLVVDGDPVSIAITGRVGDVLSVTSCDGPLALDAGEHRIASAPGRITGIDIDRLVLDSAGAGPVPTGTRADPTVDVAAVTAFAPTAIDARLPATTAPTWLILPQSLNAGWTATVDGVDLGPPTLINGYANGWLVDAGTDGRSVELRWVPQESVDVALWFSFASGIALLAGYVVGTWRRRRQRSTGSGTVVTSSAGRGLERSRYAQAGLAVAAVGGFVIVGGAAAGLAAAVTLAVHVWAGSVRRARLAAAATVCVGWAAVSGLIIASEWRYDYADGPDWPLRFAWASSITWVVVAVVVTSAAANVLAAHRRADHTAGDSLGPACDL